jgi:hypothetical protein
MALLDFRFMQKEGGINTVAGGGSDPTEDDDDDDDQGDLG